jgi:hypothetical protein
MKATYSVVLEERVIKAWSMLLVSGISPWELLRGIEWYAKEATVPELTGGCNWCHHGMTKSHDPNKVLGGLDMLCSECPDGVCRAPQVTE